MNLTISSRIVARTCRRDFYRHLSAQPSIVKSYGTLNHHRRAENRSTSFPLFREPLRGSLCNAPLPLYTSFQRNMMKKFSDPLEFIERIEGQTEPEAIQEPPRQLTFEEELEQMFSFVGDFVNYASETMPVKTAEQLFIGLHETSGMPWWATIATTAFLMRLAILPCSLTQMRTMGRLQMIALHMKKVAEKLKLESQRACKQYGWPEDIAQDKYTAAVKREWNLLIAKENCHPVKTLFLVMVQVPTWIVCSVALRNLSLPPMEGQTASDAYLQLEASNIGWLTDLTVVHQTVAFPLTLMVLYGLTVEVHRMFKVEPYDNAESIKCYLMQFLNLAIVGIATYSPAAVSIYWISSASFGLVQAFALNSQTSYRLLNIPVLNTPLEHPYSLFKTNLKGRFKLRSSPIIITEK